METGVGLYLLGLALAVGLGLGISVIGAGIGQGLAASSALRGMARQPELAGRILTSMIIALAFIESLVIFTLLLAFLMQLKLPGIDVLVETLRK
jgi:F-type H+-transporting ATPase subunit c